MQLNMHLSKWYKQGFEQIHYVLLRNLFKLIKDLSKELNN